jgi:hypothetical protein
MNAVKRYAKAIGALVGGLTPPALLAIARVAGWDLDLDTAAVLVGFLSPLGAAVATWRTPANTERHAELTNQ